MGRDKFQLKTLPCIFLGYPCGKERLQVTQPLQSFHIFFRDVIFHEHIFLYHSTQSHSLFPFDSSFSYIDHDSASFSTLHVPLPTLTYPTPLTVDTPTVSVSAITIDVPTVSVPPRRSTRPTHTPTYLNQYICSSAYIPSKLLPDEVYT